MNLFIHDYLKNQDLLGCQVLADQSVHTRAAIKGMIGTWPSQLLPDTGYNKHIQS